MVITSSPHVCQTWYYTGEDCCGCRQDGRLGCCDCSEVQVFRSSECTERGCAVLYIGKDKLAIKTMHNGTFASGPNTFTLSYLKLRSDVVSKIIKKNLSLEMAAQQILHFLVERRLYSYSGVTAAPSIAIDMSQNIVRYTETDVCHMQWVNVVLLKVVMLERVHIGYAKMNTLQYPS